MISSEYGWDDDIILNKTLKRIRQIVAVITERKLESMRNERLMISWQTRSLAMVIAASGSSGSEELMNFAANLTIDKEEYEQFGEQGYKPIEVDTKIPINAHTQEEQAKRNFEAAASKNSTELLSMFGHGLSKGKPGH